MATQAVTLHASAARTADGVGPTIDCGGAAQINTLRLTLDVTANTADGRALPPGTPGVAPIFSVYIETSPDTVAWRDVSHFTHGSAIRSERLSVDGFDRYVRCRYQLAPWNGPNGYPVGVTFAVTGDGA